MNIGFAIRVVVVSVVTWAAAGCAAGPPSAAELLRRSVEAHGGDRLTSWQTLSVKGTVKVFDGALFNAAYQLYAQKPDRLRVERDTTVEGGRLFDEAFLNGDLAWRRRNLLPRPAEPTELRQTLEECDGVALYARLSDSAVLLGEGDVEWQPAQDNLLDTEPIAPRAAYLVAVGVGDDIVELALDRDTYHLLRVKAGSTTRYFADFAAFGGVVWPTRVVEVITSERGERVLPHTYESVAYGEPIEEWLFTEDMPEHSE